MTILSHRARVALLAVLFALLALLFLTRRTHAAWSADPVEVHATAALCPLVSVAPDGAHGALVVWQEATPGGGTLRAAHLLANGDVDAAWGGPVALSSADVARTALGAVTDDAGGAYVWWMEGMQLYLTRLAAEGAVAAGWPARGRSLGPLLDAQSRPVVCADGSGGVYAAWLTTTGLLPSFVIVRAFHLGPANTAKDGWPASGRALGGTTSLGETVNTFGIGTTADGGLWVVCATSIVVENGVYEPGAVRLSRHTAAGAPSTGWTSAGVTLASFHGELLAAAPEWRLSPHMRLAAVRGAGDGGAFVLYSQMHTDGYMVGASHWMARVDAAGASAPGWAVPPPTGLGAAGDAPADCSLQLLGDGADGAFAGVPQFYDHGTDYALLRYTGGGTHLPGDDVGGGSYGLEAVERGDGGAILASCVTTAPYGPYQPPAYIAAHQSGAGSGYVEWHDGAPYQWYGDIGLTATGDGGAILAWSQVRERFGVYAIRLNPSGQVTDVPPGVAVRHLRIRYAHGRGVQVSGASGRVALSLHDLSGREVARGESADAGEWTVPGTAGLASGVYFARVRGEGRVTAARVAVIR